MAATPSTMVALESAAIPFSLPDVTSGKQVTLSERKGHFATVIMFICNHCPYVKHIEHAIVRVANDYINRGVSFIAISSNDTQAYPDDGPLLMKAVAERLRYPFPYLYDETQEVAQAYEAACTPDFFVYDRNMKLAYRGQFDDARPSNSVPVTGADLRKALDALVSGEAVSSVQKPSMGCNIKWRKQR